MITVGSSWSITGPLLFYGGIALLGVTVLLAGFFWQRRPRGVPGDSLSGADADLGERKGGPAAEDPVTVFDEAAAPDTVFSGQTVLPDQEAEGDGRTVLLDTAAELLPASGGAGRLEPEKGVHGRING